MESDGIHEDDGGPAFARTTMADLRRVAAEQDCILLLTVFPPPDGRVFATRLGREVFCEARVHQMMQAAEQHTFSLGTACFADEAQPAAFEPDTQARPGEGK